jgi:hypothetical protein
MPSLCLTLVSPPQIEEKLLDTLLEVAGNEVFTSTPTFSHGTSQGRLSGTEQVMGRSGSVQVQLLVEPDELDELLVALRTGFAGTGLRYWVTQLAQAGEIK